MLASGSRPRQPAAAGAPPVPARTHLAVALALAGLAAFLRLWRLGHGLPDFHEEAIPLREALEMWGWETGRTDLDPGFFNYPTLTIYLHFLVQKAHYLWGWLAGRYTAPADLWLTMQTDPTGPVLAARLVGVAADVAAVLLAWRLAERLRRGSGWLAAAVVALSATLVVTSREIFVDPVQAALGIAAAERLVAYQQAGGRGRLAAAVVLIGLAAGAKYNAGLLVIPLAWVVGHRHGRRALWLAPALAAASLLVFLATSPYVLLNFDEFRADFGFEQAHMAEGHLGTLGGRGSGFVFAQAREHLGWPLLAVLAAGLATLPRRRRRASEITVWLVLLPPLLAVVLFRMTAPRYLVPLMAPAAVLAAVAVRDAAEAAARAWQRRGTAGSRLFGRPGWWYTAIGAAVLVPVAAVGLRAAAAGADTTQAAARRWLETHLTRDEIVVQEAYGADLRNVFDDRLVRRHPAFAAASEPARAAFAALPRHHSIPMPLVTSGNFRVNIDTPAGVETLEVFAHGSDLNAVFYRPELLAGMDWFVRSGAVAGRYLADPERYPRQATFYRWLERFADEAARLEATITRHGPEIVIYRLGPRAQRTIAAREPLDPLWWADEVPPEFRAAADRRLAPPEQRSGGSLRSGAPGSGDGAAGEPAPWVHTLRGPFEQYVLPFLMRSSHVLEQTGKHGPAALRAAAVLAMMPELEPAVVTYGRAQTALGRADLALAALRRAQRLLVESGRSPAGLQFEEALVLARSDQFEEAARVARSVRAAVAEGTSLARRASELLDMLADARRDAEDSRAAGGPHVNDPR
ncbi:MAG: glycosyltransferase family 39 protein [Candidatus Krumholzibacteriia bacterium]